MGAVVLVLAEAGTRLMPGLEPLILLAVVPAGALSYAILAQFLGAFSMAEIKAAMRRSRKDNPA